MSELLRYRPADRTDVTALTELEERCFSNDRLSRRSFQRMVTTDRAWLAVAEQQEGTLLGYALVLFHRGTSLARLYSIAVDPAARGRGIAEELLKRAEQAAAARGRVFMRLEVNTGNHGAIHLYEKLGYQRFGIYVDYYEDHADALRMQKRIATYPHDAGHRSLPYYAQTTEFTCGPAALMMAMAALDPTYQPSRRDELQLWREATTIYMTSGHGGCGPHGLALAAWRRGFRARIHVSQRGPLFTEGVRRSQKKSVMEQVHSDFLAQLEESDVELHYSAADLGTLRRAIADGEVPLVLISSWRYDRRKAPHWVVVTAIDERFVYIHDPDIDDPDDSDNREQSHRSAFDCQYLPIEISSFLKSMQFGQQRLRAALIVGRQPSPATF
jgi:ribosomal protein S18 acetylase RimI-like enzyme